MTGSDPTKYLAEWLERYLKNRDLAFRKIISTSIQNDRVIVQGKDKNVTYISAPFINDFETAVAPLLNEKHKGIAVFNTKTNLQALIKSWKKLSTIDNLTIYFVNPFSIQDKKWVINPKTHQMISDEASLKEGINSMFLTVDEITEEEAQRRIKQGNNEN
jgi:hypothetical protein